MSKFFRDWTTPPLDNWPNDDLMLQDKHQVCVQSSFPTLYPIIDWPELRKLFELHDKSAISSKADVKRRGRWIVSFGVFGLLLAATTSLVDDNSLLKAALGGLAAIASLTSLVLGVLFRIRNPNRRRWLHSRYVTERLRHFYFQFLLAYAPDVVNAMSSEPAQKDLIEIRDNALLKFKDYRVGEKTTPTRYQEILVDITEAGMWIQEAGDRPLQWNYNYDDTNTDNVRLLFTFLRVQRIGVQLFYATKKQSNTLFSPKVLNRVVAITVDALTVLIMCTALLIGIDSLLAFGASNNLPEPALKVLNQTTLIRGWFPSTNALIVIGAIAAAFVAGLRAFSQGARLREEAERYSWYEAAVREIGRDFDEATDLNQHFNALLHLEAAAYRETRAFLASHQAARFLVD